MLLARGWRGRGSAAGAIGVAAAIAATGCGGKPSNRSEDEFLARTNAICRTFNERSAKIEEHFADAAPQGKPLAPFATALPKLADLVTKSRQELADEKPPEELATEWGAAIDQLSRNASALKVAAGAADRNDFESFQKALSGDKARLQRIEAFLDTHGLSDCGHSLGTGSHVRA